MLLAAARPAAAQVSGRRASSSSAARSATAVTATAARWAPPITVRLPALSDTDITTLIREGRPTRGMPPQVVPAADMAALLQHLPIDRAPRGTAAPPHACDRRRTHAGRRGARRGRRRPAVAHRRRPRAPAAQGGRPRPRGDVRGRLADLQRRDRRQPPHVAARHRQDQREPARAAVDGDDARRRHAPGHAGGRRRHHVRHRAERMRRARCRHRPAAVALSAGRAPRASRAAMPIAASPSPAIACS